MDRQIRRLGIVLVVAFGVLFLQLNRLQIVDARRLANATGNTRNATRDFSRARGAIQAADGTVLAQSVPSHDAFSLQRQYPTGELFAGVTGYFSFTYGTDGVERTYNDDLSGKTLPVRKLSDLLTTRTRTATVTLTLDPRIQLAAKNALGIRRGAVVALDPTNGSILALWSASSYDPNRLAAHDQNQVRQAWAGYQRQADKPMLPRAYRERYPPGSTMKVMDTAAVLDQAPDLLSRTYPTLSQLPLPQSDKPLHNFGGETCGGPIPEMLVISCDTGFAQVGLDLGPKKLTSEAHAFGLDQAPPLDLPAPAASAFPNAAAFTRNLPGLAYSAIGQQDVAATPLEMALVAGAIADNGVVQKPHVMAEVRDSEGNLVRQSNPGQWLQATSPQTAQAIRDIMIQVVQRGTATNAQIPGVQVAAKTGTAQTGRNTTDAWLIAFAPADAPKVAVAVIVEDQPPQGEVGTGGTVAAPIAKAVLSAVLGK